MSMTDVKCCVVIVRKIRDVLEAPCLEDSSITNSIKLVRLISVLRNQEANTQGAGLRGGSLVEELWKGMLFEVQCRRFIRPDKQDADYSFKPKQKRAPSISVSHKTIGFNGSGELALAWSKNQNGKNKSTFDSHFGVLFFRKPAEGRAKRFKDLKNGFYLVPKDYMNANVSGNLGSNNKTDSLIRAFQTEAAMREAVRIGCFVEIPYDDAWGHGKKIDPWPKGLASISSK